MAKAQEIQKLEREIEGGKKTEEENERQKQRKTNNSYLSFPRVFCKFSLSKTSHDSPIDVFYFPKINLFRRFNTYKILVMILWRGRGGGGIEVSSSKDR